jgi:hypothetical protein
MRRTRGLLGLLGLVGICCGSSAWAMVIAPAPLAQRVATADCIVVGKVTGFGDKTVKAPRFPGDKQKADYQIALVRVETSLVGAKDKKEIRVGFIPPRAAGAGGAVRPLPRRPLTPSFSLKQEALLFLTKHHEGDFFVAPMYFSVVNKQDNANFEQQVAEVRKCARLLEDPKAGLEAKEKSDRLLTAGMLVAHYRQPRPGVRAPKTKPIDAELSKNILRTLAEADWEARPGRPGAIALTPQTIFAQLGATAKDGWKPPRDLKQFAAAAKKWCADNADTFVIQRFVAEDESKK